MFAVWVTVGWALGVLSALGGVALAAHQLARNPERAMQWALERALQRTLVERVSDYRADAPVRYWSLEEEGVEE